MHRKLIMFILNNSNIKVLKEVVILKNLNYFFARQK